MLTLAQAKTYLKLGPPAEEPTDEDLEVQTLLAAAVGMFRVESKRRWPDMGDTFVSVLVDPAATPPTSKFVGYVNPAVLSPDEQVTAEQWVRFTLGHLYENRQTVVVDTRAAATEVPATAQMLMKLLREPTL